MEATVLTAATQPTRRVLKFLEFGSFNTTMSKVLLKLVVEYIVTNNN